jgi:hypothetical protein
MQRPAGAYNESRDPLRFDEDHHLPCSVGVCYQAGERANDRLVRKLIPSRVRQGKNRDVAELQDDERRPCWRKAVVVVMAACGAMNAKRKARLVLEYATATGNGTQDLEHPEYDKPSLRYQH